MVEHLENSTQKPIKAKENYYKLDTYYSITINPIDKYQFYTNPTRFERFRNFVYENMISTKMEYELYIEISEPHGMKTQGYTGPRLHLHGYLLFRNGTELRQFLLSGYYKLLRFASVDIDTIADRQVWKTYCTKQHLFHNRRISNFGH